MNVQKTPTNGKRLRREVQALLSDAEEHLPDDFHSRLREVSQLFFEHRREVGRLQESLTASERQLQRMTEELAEQEHKSAGCEASLKAAEKQVDQLTKELAAKQSEIDTLEKTLASHVAANDCHEWIVFSTALTEGWLMLNCKECGAMGTVDDPTKEEWAEAANAPVKPYRWADNSRVTLRLTGSAYTARADADSLDKIVLPEVLTAEELTELQVLEEVVIEGELDGQLFPVFVRSLAESTGQAALDAVESLAASIESLVDQGRVFTPAMMTIVIREFIRGADVTNRSQQAASHKLPSTTDDHIASVSFKAERNRR